MALCVTLYSLSALSQQKRTILHDDTLVLSAVHSEKQQQQQQQQQQQKQHNNKASGTSETGKMNAEQSIVLRGYSMTINEDNKSVSNKDESSKTYQTIQQMCQPFQDTVTYKSVENKDTDFNSKPVWFAFYPSTLPLPVYQHLIQTSTGLLHAAKSFYARSSTVQRCIDKRTLSITCQTVHPTVQMDKQFMDHSDYDTSTRILALRNPMTALPYHYNDKAHKYHKLPPHQQVPINDWRAVRDQYFDSMLHDWIDVIHTWQTNANNDSQPKQIVYVPHEFLSSPTRGPQVIATIIRTFSSLKFPITTSETDATCLWYTFQTSTNITSKYEYSTYAPGYTSEQKKSMLEALKSLMQLHKQNNNLIDILQQYHDEIQNNCPLDNNATTSR